MNFSEIKNEIPELGQPPRVTHKDWGSEKPELVNYLFLIKGGIEKPIERGPEKGGTFITKDEYVYCSLKHGHSHYIPSMNDMLSEDWELVTFEGKYNVE